MGVEIKNLKVLTLNTWLLKVLGRPIGKHIPHRIKLIPKAAAETGADIIALQETWSNKNKKYFAEKFLELGYVYSYYTKHFWGFGDGLMILSKFPIISTQKSPAFKKFTRLEEIFTSKRALYAEIQINEKVKIDFVTFHVGALTYDKKMGSFHLGQKARQRIQYKEFKTWFKNIRQHPISIVAGDTNANYLALIDGEFQKDFADDYLELIKHACSDTEDLTNTFLTANNMDENSEECPTFSRHNPYTTEGMFNHAPCATEDYIFSCGLKNSQIKSSKVLFQEPITHEFVREFGISENDIPHRISDHYGLMTTFEI